jgi:hypothetical protein
LLQQQQREKVYLLPVIAQHRLREKSALRVTSDISHCTMVATRAYKKAAVENKNALLYPDILRRILSFVGLGQYAFIATVSRGWKQVYASVPRHQAGGIDRDGMRKLIKCKPKTTLASAVFASVSRLRLACCCPWDPSVCDIDVAAMQGDLKTVRWLREHGYGWNSASVTKCAARSGSVPLMQYLRG